MNKNIKHVSFDLDGTLVNSCNTIYKTTLKALEYLNITAVIHEKEFHRMIGLHFINIFNDLKITVPDINHFISIYKNFYFDFIDDSEILPGVVDILEYLKGRNIQISLLTTKSQDQAEKIIKHFHLDKYFSYIMGRREGISYKPSAEPLLYICKEVKVRADETLLVGDTELDITCGKNAGSSTCAVTFGYRDLKVLEQENPDYIISDFSELRDII